MAKQWWEIMVEEDIADACEDAADLLEGHWARGHWYSATYYDDEEAYIEDGTWTYCIEGAMAAAIGLDATEMEGDENGNRQKLLACPVYGAVLETINLRMEREGLQNRFGPGDLPTWNDNDEGGCRDEQEALDVLRETAKRMHGVSA